jgi:hypothetical protein
MSQPKWIPVFASEPGEAALVKSFLEGDGIAVKTTPDVHSLPQQGPAAHGVASRYSRVVLLASEEDAARAAELVEYYLENGRG